MSNFSRRHFLLLSSSAAIATLTTNCAANNQSASSDFDPKTATWEQILERSKGSTVNWAMWGGSDTTNKFADDWVATQLREQYGITLNRVPLNDTVEAVNKVAGEVQAGQRSGGSIDLIWINGENFRTLKQGDLLFGPFTDKLPSMQYYDLSNPLVGSDFGLTIDGFEAPYNKAYYVYAYDSAKVATPPQNHTELLEWARSNPGRFAYVTPPEFDGSRFLLSMFYATTGGHEQYAGEFNETLFNQNVGKLIDYLKQLEPFLWRRGETYPPTIARLAELFANGEVWLIPAFASKIAESIANNQFPRTTKAYAMPNISLADSAFTAIPVNASNPTGAMVLAELLASPEGQLEKFKPDVWGDAPLIDARKLPTDKQQAFAAIEKSYGLPLSEFTDRTAPMVNARYTTELERVWQEQIAGS